MSAAKKVARRWLSSVFPRAADWYTTTRVRQMHQRAGRIAEVLTERYQGRVHAGPFKGMSYLQSARHSGLCPKLVGCYESEIEHVIEQGMSRRCFVDVGSAEGYYAVGAAYRGIRGNGPATVFAFDTDEACRDLCEQLAQQNGVSSAVDVRGTCAPESLEAIGADFSSVFLLCDCEGYEEQLLDPAIAPALTRFEMLVELHEFAAPGVTDLLVDRFASTHDATLIDSLDRRSPDPYDLDFLPSRRDRELAVDDLRVYPQQWLWLRPLEPSAA